MVVDDEKDIVTIVKKGLENAGFKVEGFTKPQEAIDHFKRDYHAIIITDIRMPGMNGFELYRELKKKDPSIKVAFMTAFDIYEDEFKKVLPSMNVACFFKKPVRISQLVERVREEIT